MDINNNQQVNTFTKGMNTDTSDAYLDNGEYRLAKNLRIVADNGGNTGELHTIIGVLKVNSNNKLADWDEITAMTQLRDYIVVVGKRVIKDESGNPKNTYNIYFSNVNEKGVVGNWLKALTDDIEEANFGSNVSMVGRWESDKLAKIYIADGKNPIYFINLKAIKEGAQYSQEQLHSYSSVLLPPPEVSLSTVTGHLTAAKVQYAYIVYMEGGGKTRLSSLSNSIPILETTNKGYEGSVQSNKAVDITIKNNPKFLLFSSNKTPAKVDVFRITYTSAGQTALIERIYQLDMPLDTNQDLHITDTGISLTSVTTSLAELTSLSDSAKIPRIIESKNDYLFSANIRYKQDDVDKKFADYNTEAPAVGADNAFSDYVWREEDWLLEETEENGGGSSSNEDIEDKSNAYAAILTVNNQSILGAARWHAMHIRPVADKALLYRDDFKDFSEYTEEEAMNGYPMVNYYQDLGLPSGTVWSVCNLGAYTTLQYGNIYQWGCTEPKTDGTAGASSYKYYNTKTRTYQDIGNSIKKTEYDVAKNNFTLNKLWSIPSREQFQELIDNCTIQYEHRNFRSGDRVYDINQYRFTSKINGKAILLQMDPDVSLGFWTADLKQEVTAQSRSRVAQSSLKVYGGKGENFKWKLVYEDAVVDITNTRSLSENTRSLRRGEVYRYGVILYDENGAASSVKHIADIMVPPVSVKNFEVFEPKFERSYKIRKIGVEFEMLNAPTGCSSWEIVRCERSTSDKINICQGIIGLPLRTYLDHADQNKPLVLFDSAANGTNTLCASGFMSMQPISAKDNTDGYNYNRAESDLRYALFACPEYAYDTENVKLVLDVLSNNIELDYLYSYAVTNTTAYEPNETASNGERLADFMNYLHRSCIFSRSSSDAALTMYIARYMSATSTSHYVGENKYCQFSTSCNKPEYNIANHNESFKINTIGYPATPRPDSFNDEETITVEENFTALANGDQYINWSVPYLPTLNNPEYTEDIKRVFSINKNGFNTGLDAFNIVNYPTGTGGKCIIFGVNKLNAVRSTSLLPITVANIRRTNPMPYGGTGLNAIINSVYYSSGSFVNGTTGAIRVFDGDCYPGIFTYHASHAWYSAKYPRVNKMVTIYCVPVESDIDLRATCGVLYSNQPDEFIQDIPSLIETGIAGKEYTQDHDAYIYNTAYSSIENVIQYTSTHYSSISTNEYDCRVLCSELKTNGEITDSWLLYKASNTIDVDTRYGQITNLRTFHDRLIYWQEHAVGILSVNDRAVIQNATDVDLVLGTGGILDRYDYISTVYGMRDTHYSDVQSDTTLYWWDGNNREILAYNQQLLPMTKVKNVRKYINDGSDTKSPAMIYDNEHNELLANVVNDELLVYNENTQSFTSVYDAAPLFKATPNQKLFVADKKNIYAWEAATGTNDVLLFNNTKALPYIKYVVNNQSTYVKTFDIQTFGGSFYGNDNVDALTFTYSTPLKQESSIVGKFYKDRNIDSTGTNLEYDFRLTIPRNGSNREKAKDFGDRMRGKTMQCEIKSENNSKDFSLQYVITKYRMSWS